MGRVALLKHCLLQGILQHLRIVLPALGNAVNVHALEHLSSQKSETRRAAGRVVGGVGEPRSVGIDQQAMGAAWQLKHTKAASARCAPQLFAVIAVPGRDVALSRLFR